MRDVFWFNPHTFDDEKDWQVQLGVLFNARIKWLDDGLEQDAVMATYDTEVCQKITRYSLVLIVRILITISSLKN